MRSFPADILPDRYKPSSDSLSGPFTRQQPHSRRGNGQLLPLLGANRVVMSARLAMPGDMRNRDLSFEPPVRLAAYDLHMYAGGQGRGRAIDPLVGSGSRA